MARSTLRPAPSRVLGTVGLASAALLVLASTQSAAQSPVPWVQLPSAEIRFGHTALLDEPGGRMVVIGGGFSLFGAGAPLAFDLARDEWSALATDGDAPAPRTGTGMVRGSGAVVDGAERVAVVSCDCLGGSTYLLDLADDRWMQAPNDEELRVVGGTLVYDSVGDRVLLQGGRQYGIGEALNAGHAYDMSPTRMGWHELPVAPFALVDQSAVFAADAGHVLAFGGQTDDGDFVNQLWRLDTSRLDQEGAWQDITQLAGPGPSGRVGASFVYVPALHAAILYGGYAPGTDNGDLWLLDYEDPAAPRWQLIAAESVGPGPRAAHSALWDAAHSRMILYAGTRGDGGAITLLDDAWALVEGGLTPVPTADATSTMPTEPSTPPVPSDTATPTDAPVPPNAVWLPVSDRHSG